MKNRSASILAKPVAVPCLLAVMALCGSVSGGDCHTQPKGINPAPGAALPDLPRNTGGFHAYYTRLRTAPEWEKPWRIGDFADVVVCFPGNKTGFVFWHGAGYIPNWVTENGIWYNNQFVERCSVGIKETKGCVEPMSDKQCRYSQVRIVQDNAVRKIVHWRYAPVDVEYRHPYVDPATGWFDWVDEYYYLYPDAVATRAATLHSTEVNAFADWQESIVVHQAGRKPEDNIESTAVSIGNLKGETRDYFWPETSKKTSLDGLPDQCCIQVVNLKSPLRPFIVIPPDPGVEVGLFDKHGTHSIFRQWDHWPVSQDKNWGREAVDDSKPSHTSLTWWKGWNPVASSGQSKTLVMLHGMTDQRPDDLVPLAKSWLQPARVSVSGEDAAFDGYDRTQRAYVFTLRNPAKNPQLAFDIHAGPDTPLRHLVFLIRNWTAAEAMVTFEGTSQKITNIRQSVEYGPEQNSLVLWVPADIAAPVRVTVKPVGKLSAGADQ